MRRLTANKTKLYDLVKRFEPLPDRRKTRFVKAYRSPSYWLRWVRVEDGEMLNCEAYLSAVLGIPKLAIEAHDQSGNSLMRAVFCLDMDELAKRGMVETFTSKWELRRKGNGTV